MGIPRVSEQEYEADCGKGADPHRTARMLAFEVFTCTKCDERQVRIKDFLQVRGKNI